MQNPCSLNVPCVPCADGNPLAGNSSEAPDSPVFFAIGFASPPLPLGTSFQALGCVMLAESTVSPEEAGLLAESAAQLCATSTWTVITNGPGPGPQIPNPPVPPPQSPTGGAPFNGFLNSPQTGSADCPDGTSFFWTTPAGLFTGLTQAIADAKAQSYATQQAALLITCLSNLPMQVCANTDFNQTITATGMDANEGTNNWELLNGMLPQGVTFSGSGIAGTFSGTATMPGVYSFLIGVTGMDGGFVQKFYTVSVAGINDTLPDATIGTDYNGALTTAGFTTPMFALASGTLPDGLTLNPDGTVTGTPEDDAVTSTFGVSITDGTTGLVCSQDVTITVTMAGFSWNDLVWDDPPDGIDGGVTFTNVGGLFTGAANNGGSFNNSGNLTYTGPAVNVNLAFDLISVGIAGADCGGSIDSDTDGHLLDWFFNTGSTPGLYNFPFTIPVSAGSTITVSVFLESAIGSQSYSGQLS